MTDTIKNLKIEKYYLKIVKYLNNGLIHSHSEKFGNSIRGLNQLKDYDREKEDKLRVLLNKDKLNYKYFIYELDNKVSDKINLVESLN